MLNYLKKITLKTLPSSKLNEDISLSYSKCGTLQPISLKGLSLTPPIKKRILSIRRKNKNILVYRENKKLTLIIPYRNRKEHLAKFLPFIQELLNEQGLNYEIIIAQQDDNNPFNKAKLMNIGVLYAHQESEYFIFHDVDALPHDVDYRYCNQTAKVFNYIKKDNQKYEECSQTIFGGAILVPKDIFYDINGFSNNYWQWGKEDDDFLLRHLFKGYVPFLDTNGKLDMLPHLKAFIADIKGQKTTDHKILLQNKRLKKRNKKIFSNFKRGKNIQDTDGINNVNDYKITSIDTKNKIKTINIQFTNIFQNGAVH